MPLHSVPNAAQSKYITAKAPQSQSLSHTQFPNHFGSSDIQEQFEPSFVKLDKHVSAVLCRCGPVLDRSRSCEFIGYTSGCSVAGRQALLGK